MFIDKQSPVPVYYQLKNYILEKIKSGQWPKDKPIPSERELSEQAKVSRMTVRQALNELVNDGVLYRIKGTGTFISKSKIEQKNIMSFSQMTRSKGITPVTKVLEMDKSSLFPGISEMLGVERDTRFYRIKRLRKADDIPIAIEEVFIPENYCPGIDRFDLSRSLYGLLLDEYQYKIGRMDLNMEAVLPDEKQCQLLQVNRTIPLLKVSGNTITTMGLSLFYEMSCYRSDKFSHKVSIFNRSDY